MDRLRHIHVSYSSTFKNFNVKIPRITILAELTSGYSIYKFKFIANTKLSKLISAIMVKQQGTLYGALNLECWYVKEYRVGHASINTQYSRSVIVSSISRPSSFVFAGYGQLLNFNEKKSDYINRRQNP